MFKDDYPNFKISFYTSYFILTFHFEVLGIVLEICKKLEIAQ